MKNYLVALGVIFVCGVSYADNVYTPLLIQCGGPEGMFVLQTDPDTKTVDFKLNEQGHVTQGNPKIPPGAQGQFEVTSHPATPYTGPWLAVKSFIVENVYVPPKPGVCRPTRAPNSCEGPQPIIPAHYEWQPVFGVDADFEGKGDGTYEVAAIILKGAEQKSFVPVGKPNTCTVKGF